jgi:hypothetical protein
MYNNGSNPNINIDKVENGYIVSITYPGRGFDPMDIVDKIVPMFEKVKNQLDGEEWKDVMDNEINEALQQQPPKPFRQYVCKDWSEVLIKINDENF